jgi:hypothetical protein
MPRFGRLGRTNKIVVIGVGTGTLLIAGWLAVARLKRDATPLGPSLMIDYRPPNTPISQSDVQRFLDGDFRTIKDMKALPDPVIKAFTERDGSRLTIANPGKKFEATDVILDASVPRRRLLFAGVLADRSFVLYEQGGIGLFYVLVLFQTNSPDATKPIWQGYCGPVSNLDELRSYVSKGHCHGEEP